MIWPSIPYETSLTCSVKSLSLSASRCQIMSRAKSREASGSLLRDEDGAEARRGAGVDIGDDARELRQVEVAVVVGVVAAEDLLELLLTLPANQHAAQKKSEGWSLHQRVGD